MSSSSNIQETKKKILVPIADGSEEIETTCIQDTLVRFGGDVILASVNGSGNLICEMSRGIKILADQTIDDASKKEWDCIVLPGGMPGAEHMRDCKTLITLLKKQNNEGKLYAAICASPAVALAPHGLTKKGATCYPAPAFRDAIENASDDDVVTQENLVTSQGPGTSLKFALQIGEQLYGKDKADEIAKAMLVIDDGTDPTLPEW
eukprot:CAMPEP_0194365322 /NCGR_PEP_ID=MMETSP0174-20130528/13328_1 /TAXON_ID=216777 /ORGANISM="Proboscia alata, Strain PI-D3" /LENGTH=205 /DNA_ID=CAMNT_0039139909 /DNA_START=709 /DNA_END=1324 /DNA_ORIENTATION=+